MRELIELGLTSNETKVYLALLNHGTLGSTEVSKWSTVPYGRVYEVLDSLHNKAIVQIIPGKTKKFALASPESLLRVVEEKEENLKKIKSKIKEMKKKYDSQKGEPVKVAYGQKNFYKLAREIKSAKKFMYTVKWTSEFNPEFIRSTEKHIKKGRQVKSLTRFDEETEENVKKWLEINPNIRKIENDGVAMAINETEEVLITLIKSNAHMLIRDKPFAKLMKKMFEETYKNAEKIT